MRKIAVKIVLGYLRFFTKIQLSKLHPIIIGVGGSSGKSSLCEIISIALSAKYTVKQGKGKNSETGIPLDILGIHMKSYTPFDWAKTLFAAPLKIFTNWEKYDVYVVEMGIDSPFEPKNMSYLLKIVQPTIAATTNVSLEHTVYFDSLVTDKDEEKRKEKLLQLVAEQETLLLTALPSHGTAIVNVDDAYVSTVQKDIHAKQITVSLKNTKADVYAEKIDISLEKFSLSAMLDQTKNLLTDSSTPSRTLCIIFFDGISNCKTIRY